MESAGWRWSVHEGVDVLRVDYRGLGHEEELALLLEITEVISSLPPGVPVLVHNDARLPTLEYARVAMEIGRTVFAPRRTRMAILGLPSAAIMGLRTFSAVTGGRRVAAFRDEAQALAFLVAPAAQNVA